MQDTDFSLKVTDFIAGKSFEDSVKFSNKFSTSLPQLNNGVSCDIDIQWWWDKTILLTIRNLAYSQEHTCDVCTERFEETKTPEDFFIKCYADYNQWLLKEDEIIFDSKHWVIDLEDLFVQEILLDGSIKNVCKNCQQNEPQRIDGNIKGNDIKRTF